jgi:hypothetical protein
VRRATKDLLVYKEQEGNKVIKDLLVYKVLPVRRVFKEDKDLV